MALTAQHGRAEAEDLDGGAGGAAEQRGARRQRDDVLAVALHQPQRPGAEPGRGRRLGQLDLVDGAVERLCPRPRLHHAAQRVSDQLMSEADPHERQAPGMRLADQLADRLHPRPALRHHGAAAAPAVAFFAFFFVVMVLRLMI